MVFSMKTLLLALLIAPASLVLAQKEKLFGKFESKEKLSEKLATKESLFGKEKLVEQMEKKPNLKGSFRDLSNANVPPYSPNFSQFNTLVYDYYMACDETISDGFLVFVDPDGSSPPSVTVSGVSAGVTVDFTTIPGVNNQLIAIVNWTPTYAATVNLSFTVSDGIVTVVYQLNLIFPGPCCTGPTAEIWNPTTDAFVEPLVNGGTYCLTRYNLRVVPCGLAQQVFMKLWCTTTGITQIRQTDTVVPYFLWGDRVNATGYVDVKSSPKLQLPNANYALRINITNPNAYAEIRFKQLCP